MTFPIKQNDRLPFLRATLKNGSTPLDLTAATVTFKMMYRESGVEKLSALATVLDAVNGVVEYQWQAGDTALPGKYDYVFVVNKEGVLQTFPSSGYGTVVVEGVAPNFIDQRAEVQQGHVDSLTYFVMDNGSPRPPDANSAWVTVLDPNGDVKVARTQSGVSTAAERVAYTRDWTGYELLEDFVLLVEWQLDGVTFTDRLFFDVVRTKLRCPVTTEDIVDLYPDIEEHLPAIIQTSAAKFIRRAWSQVLDILRSGRNRPSLILDRARLVNPTLHLAAHLMCAALTKGLDDVWHLRAQAHQKQFDRLMAGLGELKYDKDEDGLAGEEETKRMNRRLFSV